MASKAALIPRLQSLLSNDFHRRRATRRKSIEAVNGLAFLTNFTVPPSDQAIQCQ